MLVHKNMTELSDMLSRGEVSAVEIARAYIDRINNINSELNAFITISEERLLKEAAESDNRRKKGEPLSKYDGIPVALKDNISTKDLKTTCGSAVLADYIPPFNAEVYERLRGAGFTTIGKTNMDEFAMGSTTESSHFGVTCNPYDRRRVPGGSSGGSAAAVSAMMTPAALGTDTGGSIRQPASWCGVAGIKPTYGRVSRYGIVAYASSLDQAGTFGRSVDDAAELLAVISGHDRKDSTSIDQPVDFSGLNDTDLKGMVIGIPDEYFEGVDPEIKEKVMSEARKLESAGAKLERVSLKYTEYAIPVYYVISTAEASSNLARYDGVRYGLRAEKASSLHDLYYKTRALGFGKETKRRIILGTFSLSSGYYDAYYLKALKGRTLIINDFREVFKKVDALISPVSPTVASGLGDLMEDPLKMYVSDVLTLSVNLAGIPGISVPVGLNSAGLPIGLQIMSDHFNEKALIKIAKRIEEGCEKTWPDI